MTRQASEEFVPDREALMNGVCVHYAPRDFIFMALFTCMIT